MRPLLPLAVFFSVAYALSTPGLLKRTSEDTCAYLPAPVIIKLPGINEMISASATCLCVSQVPAFVNSKDFYVLMAVQEVGADAVAAALTSLVINTNEQCNYPENALSYCPANKPCSFTCTNGFTVSGNDCVCLPPNQACNGVCSATVTCPSSTSQQRREHNMWQKRTSCDVGFTACGSTGSYRKSIGAYECVDTRTDLESCGGCNIPLHKHSPRGRDCTAIPGVADVSCYNGGCRVYECMPGYTVSPDRSTCYTDDQLRGIKEFLENPYKLV